MLTDFNLQIILQFQQSLESLQIGLITPQLDLKIIYSQCHQVQTLFQDQVMKLQFEDNHPVLPKWQSYLTETHKQLRLLIVDLRRLQAARQGKTAEIRQGQIMNRLETLIAYCQAILPLFSSP